MNRLVYSCIWTTVSVAAVTFLSSCGQLLSNSLSSMTLDVIKNEEAVRLKSEKEADKIGKAIVIVLAKDVKTNEVIDLDSLNYQLVDKDKVPNDAFKTRFIERETDDLQKCPKCNTEVNKVQSSCACGHLLVSVLSQNMLASTDLKTGHILQHGDVYNITTQKR